MTSPSAAAPTPSPRAGVLAVVGVVVLALNLRPAVNAVGALLPEIRSALGLSATVAGALTSMPPLCFAAFGLLAPGLSARLGTERVLVIGLALMTAGQLLRVLGGTTALFAGSLTALAGLALCNVLLPSVIRAYFPTRIPTLTALYTTCLVVGAATSSSVSVPLARAANADWRLGAGMWAAVTAVALLPWLVLIGHNPRSDGAVGSAPAEPGGAAVPVRSLRRSRVAWTIAVYFGLQSTQAYVVTSWLAQIMVDGGADLQAGGYAVGIFSVLGAVGALAVPLLVRNETRLRRAITGLAALYVVGYAGLIVHPQAAVWAWSVLLGLASGSFPLILALVALRARTPSGVAALSAFGQSVGYLIGCVGPVLIGGLHDLTGGWTVPLVVMICTCVLMGLVGRRAARPDVVEDDLDGRLPGTARTA